MKRMILAASVIAVATGTASAVDYFGPGIVIDANNPAGGVSSIVVPDGFTITEVEVTLFWEFHTWMGDLDVYLEHQDTGTMVPLFVHVGGGSFGDSSDLGGAYTFDDDAFPAGDFWQAAADTGSADPIPSGTYYPTDAGNNQTFLASFDGEVAAGTWNLIVTDTYEGADYGTMTEWQLTLIPSPAVLGLFGIAALGRRRRR